MKEAARSLRAKLNALLEVQFVICCSLLFHHLLSSPDCILNCYFQILEGPMWFVATVPQQLLLFLLEPPELLSVLHARVLVVTIFGEFYSWFPHCVCVWLVGFSDFLPLICICNCYNQKTDFVYSLIYIFMEHNRDFQKRRAYKSAF